MKFPMPNLHDLETAVVVFVSAGAAQLSQGTSFDKAALWSALTAGISAVVHYALANRASGATKE